MLNRLDRLYIQAQIKKRMFIENLKNDESGVSNFVATVLLILMVVLIGGADFDNIGIRQIIGAFFPGGGILIFPIVARGKDK